MKEKNFYILLKIVSFDENVTKALLILISKFAFRHIVFLLVLHIISKKDTQIPQDTLCARFYCLI